MSAVSANALIKLTEIIDNFLQGFVERNLGSCKVRGKLTLLSRIVGHDYFALYGPQSICRPSNRCEAA